MEPAESKTLVGTVVFLAANRGSKSEGTFPFLYLGRDAKPVRLLLKDDNPFENKGLSEYDGMAVEVTGRVADGGTLVVDHVRTINTSTKENDE